MLSRVDYLKGRDTLYAADFTAQISANADHTIACVNLGLALYFADNPNADRVLCNSGWRPPEVNGKTAGAAVHSRHMTAEACDLSDPKHALALWSLRNVTRLQGCGILAMERPESTPDWCHWQTPAVGSGVFAFWPTISAEQAWARSGVPLLT